MARRRLRLDDEPDTSVDLVVTYPNGIYSDVITGDPGDWHIALHGDPLDCLTWNDAIAYISQDYGGVLYIEDMQQILDRAYNVVKRGYIADPVEDNQYMKEEES